MGSQQYLSNDTIHALATPTGGALAVVRVSGPLALKILDELSGKKEGFTRNKAARTLFRAKIVNLSGTLLDDAMASYFVAPKSHTGEDGFELYLHGGRVVAEAVLEALYQLGSRQALPGEFSFRAVRNGKLGLSEAQAVADLISAKNPQAATLALEKMAGSQSRLIMDMAEEVRKLAAMAELGIDFSDQDVEELSLVSLKRRASELADKLRRLEGSFDRGRKIQEGIRAAFIGRPNAGKSSFFNALLGEERSIVSEIAGTTRDVVRESLTLRNASGEASITLRLEDTAGIRKVTNDQIERVGIERSIQSAREAEIVFLVSEAGETPEQQAETLAVWSAIGEPIDKTVFVLTKIDQVDDEAIEKSLRALKALGAKAVFPVSSTQVRGIGEAAQGVVDFARQWIERETGEVLLTRMDHLNAVQSALNHLNRADSAVSEDLFASDLRQALVALGPVIGETLPDDILGRIFSEFCIGK